jgi:hypothetical protein
MDRRFRGDGPESLVRGVLALLTYARTHPTLNFNFGPLSLEALVRDGILLRGPDISGAVDVLIEIPGLAAVRD